jgi:hypothetical protein
MLFAIPLIFSGCKDRKKGTKVQRLNGSKAYRMKWRADDWGRGM